MHPRFEGLRNSRSTWRRLLTSTTWRTWDSAWKISKNIFTKRTAIVPNMTAFISKDKKVHSSLLLAPSKWKRQKKLNISCTKSGPSLQIQFYRKVFEIARSPQIMFTNGLTTLHNLFQYTPQGRNAGLHDLFMCLSSRDLEESYLDM